MALTPASILSALQSSRAAGGFPLAGPRSDGFLSGIANGVSSWAVGQPNNLQLTGTVVGAAGVGNILAPTTRVFLLPNEGVVTSALSGSQVAGPVAPSLGRVVALGIAQAFSTAAQYTGVSSSVGVGQDVAVVTTVNAASLMSALWSALDGSLGGSGPSATDVSVGLGNGIATMLLTATGTGTVTGVAGPTPASGLSMSVVV